MDKFIETCMENGALVVRKGIVGKDRDFLKVIAPDGHTFNVHRCANEKVKTVLANTVKYLNDKRLKRFNRNIIEIIEGSVEK